VGRNGQRGVILNRGEEPGILEGIGSSRPVVAESGIVTSKKKIPGLVSKNEWSNQGPTESTKEAGGEGDRKGRYKEIGILRGEEKNGEKAANEAPTTLSQNAGEGRVVWGKCTVGGGQWVYGGGVGGGRIEWSGKMGGAVSHEPTGTGELALGGGGGVGGAERFQKGDKGEDTESDDKGSITKRERHLAVGKGGKTEGEGAGGHGRTGKPKQRLRWFFQGREAVTGGNSATAGRNGSTGKKLKKHSEKPMTHKLT